MESLMQQARDFKNQPILPTAHTLFRDLCEEVLGVKATFPASFTQMPTLGDWVREHLLLTDDADRQRQFIECMAHAMIQETPIGMKSPVLMVLPHQNLITQVM